MIVFKQEWWDFINRNTHYDEDVDIVIQQNTTVKYLYESSNDVFESKQEHAVQQYVLISSSCLVKPYDV